MAEKNVENTDTKDVKSLDYFGILGKSWRLVRENKHLWFLGILAGTAGSNFNFNGNSSSFGNFQGDTGSTPDAANVERFFSAVGTWIKNNLSLVVLIAFIVAVIAVIWWILSVMATGGLVSAVDKLDRKESSTFKKAMRFGWHKFWRILGLGILLTLYGLAVFLALALPALFFALAKLWPIFVLYIIPAVLFFIIFIIALGIVFQYSLRYATLSDNKIMDSIRSGYNLLKSKKKEAFFLFLMNILIGVIGAVVIFIAIFLLFFILGLLGYIFWTATSSWAAVIGYAIPAGLVFLAIMAVVGGFFSAFVSSYWTLAFKELAE